MLVPAEGGRYNKITLPPLDSDDGQFDIEVKAVFTADVDGDGSPELCVLSQYYRNGSGEDPYIETDVFRWDGTRFAFFTQPPRPRST